MTSIDQAAPHANTRTGSLPLTAIAAFLFIAMSIAGVLLRPAMPIDETRYLTVAWEMHLNGNWIVPHLNGEIYSHKPPLLFWLINLVWTVTGPSEFAARLVGPAFGLASVLAVSGLGRALYPERRAGGYAALALTGMMGFAFFAGLTMFDAMLTLATTLGVWALVRAVRTEGWQPWAIWGAMIALGVVSKGPVILVFLAPIALATPFWAGISAKQMLKGVGIGLAVALGLVALWLIPALLLGGPEYREEILWRQSAGRMVDSFAHQKPWWFFLPILPLLTWPWSWSLAFWRNLRARMTGPLLVWIVAPVVFFSLISGKQTHYLLPMLPAVALLAATALAEMRVRAPLAALIPAGAGLYLIGIGLGLVRGEAGNVLGPSWLIIPIGLALLAIAAIAILSEGPWLAVMAPAFITTLSLVFLGAAGQIYDAGFLGRILLSHDAAGVATLDDGYAGEFGYAGRLTRPVTEFTDVAEAEAWLQAEPGRVLMGRMDRDQPKAGPDQIVDFRGRDYGLWFTNKNKNEAVQ